MSVKRLLLVLMLALGLTSCASEERVTTNKYNEVIYDYFDTVSSFIVYTDRDKDYRNYREILMRDMEKYHQLFNTYYDFEGVNNIKTINDNAGKEPVKVDPAIIELLEYGIDLYDETDGRINIALGNLIGLWHDYREEAIKDPQAAKLPTEAELKKTMEHTDIKAIEIDKEAGTVYISDPKVRIDTGAIGKGYAIKKMEEHLREAGLEYGILSIGGDDVVIGTNPTNESGKFVIAIQNPDDKATSNPYSSIIGLSNNTVVTSGDYQRFYKVDGKVYHHIIDPLTMYPSQYFRSVSVIHEDIALADALSTYLFIIPLEEGMEVAEKYGAEVLWIDHNDRYFKTPGWESYEE